MRTGAIGLVMLLMLSPLAVAQATQPVDPGKLPHLKVDREKRQVRVECEALRVDMPLEFFCVINGGSEHEAALRSPVKPSHVHLALLMLGLEPGKPVRYSDAAKRWLPPEGPPLQIFCEWESDDGVVSVPAYRMMRNTKSKREMPPLTWIFVGSQVMDDGTYAADATGYLVSIVNFDLTVIDIPELASSDNDSLEWEINPDVMPPMGTKVTLVIQPTGAGAVEAAGAGEEPADAPAAEPTGIARITAEGEIEYDGLPVTVDQLVERIRKMNGSRPAKVRLVVEEGAPQDLAGQVTEALKGVDVSVTFASASGSPSPLQADEARMAALRERWEKAVEPHADALRRASQTHYEVIRELRDEQQRLIGEVDRLQRLIDELEAAYQQATTPRPMPGE